MKRQFYFFVGTTAELIRIAPIIKELRSRKVDPKLIFSGQTAIKIEEIQDFVGPIKPYITFKEKVNKYSTLLFILWALRTLFVGLFILGKEFKGVNKKNTYFVIYGDPVSTSIGAVIAKIYGLTLVHLESGDLSGNLLEPFPEEICRNINIRLADILFPPSKWAEGNIKKINKVKINTHLNTLTESFYWFTRKKVKTRKELKGKKYYILILHRQEHILFGKDWSREVLEFVVKNTDKNLTCVLFNHPFVVKGINSLVLNSKIERKKFVILPYVSYSEFLKLLKDSEFIATDGATNQFETYLMGKPCLLLRSYTEQIEGLGKNVVLSKGDKNVMSKFLKNYKKYESLPVKTKIRPSKIVVDYLMKV